ncbi:hypothetical protein [Streptomyces caniscabiei]|jgi:hypothetical protein|uniref:hypothetical protein n=1 Tax=Streptomyces caniscabiei TaxID=2746961 RepID=UPI0029B1B9C2|nr:hypothetical protein [Streptomyces caniscabiei]MDX2986339.1 hypothetical protein [Streptomyces caniscabiei]
MRNEQPPRPAEPTLAEFREFLLDAAREAPQPGFWRSTLQEGVTRIFVDTIDTYLAAHAETTQAGGGPNDPNPLTRDYLAHLAWAHRNATRTDVADLDGLLDQIAHDLDLIDVRIMRGAWAAITDAMPRIALAARENGKSPDQIAQATGYTSSRIAQFVRQEKQRRAAIPLARYSWRVDVMDLDGTWLDREHGEGDLDPDDLPGEGNRLIDESGARTGRARIFLWEGDEDDDAAAVHTLDRTKH